MISSCRLIRRYQDHAYAGEKCWVRLIPKTFRDGRKFLTKITNFCPFFLSTPQQLNFSCTFPAIFSFCNYSPPLKNHFGLLKFWPTQSIWLHNEKALFSWSWTANFGLDFIEATVWKVLYLENNKYTMFFCVYMA